MGVGVGGATGRGGEGTAGRATGGGGGAAGFCGTGGPAGRGGAAGCWTRAGGVAAWGGAAGKGVPQNPQNLLPAGNDLWHFGHITCGTTGAAEGRGAGAADAGAACNGFPQRAHVGKDAGFIFPQEMHRM
ncbi:MAG: PE-PGRS family protein [Terriglobia bacterium]|jgi:hypothetical protein